MEKINEWLDNKKRDYNEGVNLFVKHGKNRNLKNLFMRKHNSHTEKKLFYELTKLAGRADEFNKKEIKAIEAKKTRQKAKEEKEEKLVLISNAKKIYGEGIEFDEGKTVEELKEQIAELEAQTQEQQDDIDNLKDNVDDINGKLDKLAEYEAKRPRIVDNPEVDVKELPDNLKELYFQNKELVKERGVLHLKAKDTSIVTEAREELIAKLTEIDNQINANWKTIDTWWQEKQAGSNNETKLPIKNPVTAKEINALEDVEKRTILKQKRIKANKRYINEYSFSTKEKQLKEVELRKAELDAWEISYTIPTKGDK